MAERYSVSNSEIIVSGAAIKKTLLNELEEKMDNFTIEIGIHITDKDMLFSAFDPLKIGLSKFNNWHAFEDVLSLSLEHRDIRVKVVCSHKNQLPIEDFKNFQSMLQSMRSEFPEKFSFSFSNCSDIVQLK